MKWQQLATPAGSKRARTTRKRRFPAEVLTAAEVNALLDACGPERDPNTRARASALRLRALIAVMYRSGLRVAEALDLYPKDIDAGAGTVRVLRGKGGFARTVGIDPGATRIVAAWLAARADLGFTDADPLFATSPRRALSKDYVRRLLPALARQAGIAKRVHCHGLRHTHAAELRAEGVDIAIIRRQLGHRSIATTVRYLDHLNPTAVVERIRGRVW
jgi:site-specific recombinase XerD